MFRKLTPCAFTLSSHCIITEVRASLHHGPWSWTMEDGIFSWSNFHGLISLKKSIYKAFGPLTRCKLNVDQEEQPCTKRNDHAPKSECAGFFFNICPKGQFWFKKNASLNVLLSSLVFIFFPPNKISLKLSRNNISLPLQGWYQLIWDLDKLRGCLHHGPRSRPKVL